jgi:hypothetical protein
VPSEHMRSYRLEMWPARLGWHWWVRRCINGRPDPGRPDRYPWALTRGRAERKARRRVNRLAAAQGRMEGLVAVELVPVALPPEI